MPEGRVFTRGATLTMDFSATGQGVAREHEIHVLTSPLTMLPLGATLDPAGRTLTAVLDHFTEVQGGSGAQAFADLQAWGDAILMAKDPPASLREIQSFANIQALCQLDPTRQGCETSSVEELKRLAGSAIERLVQAACEQGRAVASAAASDIGAGLTFIRRLATLGTLAQQFNLDILPRITACVRFILEPLIDQAGEAALADPEPPATDDNDPRLQLLLPPPESDPGRASLFKVAEQFDLTDLVLRSLEKVKAALAARVERAGDTALADPFSEPTLQRLELLARLARSLGSTDVEARAGTRLAQAVRETLRLAQQVCADDPRSGTILLAFAGRFALLAAALSPNADPTLFGDIQRALTTCQEPRFTFTGVYGPGISPVDPRSKIEIFQSGNVATLDDCEPDLCSFLLNPNGCGVFGLCTLQRWQGSITGNTLVGQGVPFELCFGGPCQLRPNPCTITATLDGNRLTGAVTCPGQNASPFDAMRESR